MAENRAADSAGLVVVVVVVLGRDVQKADKTHAVVEHIAAAVESHGIDTDSI